MTRNVDTDAAHTHYRGLLGRMEDAKRRRDAHDLSLATQHRDEAQSLDAVLDPRD